MAPVCTGNVFFRKLKLHEARAASANIMQFTIAFYCRLVGWKPTSRNSEFIFRKRNPLAVFLDRASEFNIRIINLRIGSCLACVYRVMDARGKFGEHERSVRVA